jgi:hypothetical protein
MEISAGKGGLTLNGKRPLTADVEEFEPARDAVARSYDARVVNRAVVLQTPSLCMRPTKEEVMTEHEIKENMEVIGADGVHVGTVDRIVDDRIKLKRLDSGDEMHKGHHHYIEMGFVAGVEGQKVRLSANAAIAVTLEEEKSGRPVDLK